MAAVVGVRGPVASPPTIERVARVGAVVRRGEDYGVVTKVNDVKFDEVEVEWDDGRIQWVKVADLEWVISGE